MVIVLKCHTCNCSDEPQNMYRGNSDLIWYCKDCYDERRKKFKGKIKKPVKVMSYEEQQKIHKAKWKRFKKVMKHGRNVNKQRDHKSV